MTRNIIRAITGGRPSGGAGAGQQILINGAGATFPVSDVFEVV